MSSARPLSVSELALAVAQDSEVDHFIPKEYSIEIILKACHNLIIVDSWEGCRFSHLSVQEYVEMNLWDTQQGNIFAAQACLVALNDLSIYTHEDLSWPPRAYLSHVIRYWDSYVRKVGSDPGDSRVEQLLNKFLGTVDGSAEAYLKWYTAAQNHRLEVYDLVPTSSPVFAVCKFGFDWILSRWLMNGCVKTDLENLNKDSLLYIASGNGQTGAVTVLVKAGADVNHLNGNRGTALQIAAAGGFRSIVEVLLEHGADVNLVAGRYGTALQAAAIHSVETIARLLIDRGADLNLVGGSCGTVLQAAVLYLSEPTVQLLLNQGANVNTVGGEYGTALQAAAYKGYTSLVWLLLKANADVNLQCGKYGNALRAAILESNRVVEQILRLNGAIGSSEYPTIL
jgi:ankyrin repeat protein